MAMLKVRGNAYNVIYVCRMDGNQKKQIWETYSTEREATQRKAFIDYLQKTKQTNEIVKAAKEYHKVRAVERATKAALQDSSEEAALVASPQSDNLTKTYREFIEKWLPYRARKKAFSPNTYDSYRSNLNNHILPFLGDMIMSEITEEDIDDFIDALRRTVCGGSKAYLRCAKDAPTLSTSSVKKCYMILMTSFSDAKKWGYVQTIPETAAPSGHFKKRRAWDHATVFAFLESIHEDKLFHLAVHLAFVCSLRAGEVAGLDYRTVDFSDGSMWITQQVQRVSDEALREIPKEEINRVFPKMVSTAKSSMILKGLKTEGSLRKQYLTAPLMQEIRERMKEIEEHKDFLGSEYNDYGLLMCQPDGRPLDPRAFDKQFKKLQIISGIPENKRIEFQGLRKSGQMHKVRLSQNNYQLVAESSGQSPEVLMAHYNEALDSEKRDLSKMVEQSFYPRAEIGQTTQAHADTSLDELLHKIQQSSTENRALLKDLLAKALADL